MHDPRLFRRLAAAAAVAFAMVAASAPATIHGFAALPIDQAQETPPTGSTGSGELNCVYDDVTNILSWTFSYTLDPGSTQLTMAHFHGPAPAGMPAGIIITLVGSPTGPSGTFSGTSTLTEPQEADLLGGLWYINLHSDVHGGGEIRGQLIVSASTHQINAVPVDFAQEFPVPPVPSTATGTLTASYDTVSRNLTYAIEWNGLTSSLDMMHYHGPAAPGVPAGITIGLSGFSNATTGVHVDTVTLTAGQEPDFLNDLWYINLHTGMNPGGEIRGQALVDPLVTAATGWAGY